MFVIHKFPLQLINAQTIQMPEGSSVIDVAEQGGNVCIWAIVDTDNPMEGVTLFIKGTGEELPKFGEYLGSTHISPFVWHVFKELDG